MQAKLGKIKLLLSLAAALGLGACATAQKRVTVAQPPPPRPASPEVLPLRPAESLLRSPYARTYDPVDLLIRKAEDLYATGKEEYRLGNTENAKENFDRAVSSLLEAQVDPDGRERLTAEVDKLADNIHSLEFAPPENVDAAAPHKYVTAPIEAFTGLTFPVDPNVKQHVQQEVKVVSSDLPLVSNDYVAGVINFFQHHAHGQEYIRRVILRSGLYEPIISEALRKEGLPQELMYVAAGESAFTPSALSHVGAVGIWQFMLARAQEYGLKKDRWVDEREDPAKSTLAAARHLKELYQMFGDWYLAMAAYDSGPVTIQKAIEKTGYADFWALRRLGALPKETENYVPIFLATTLIAKNPSAFGFDVQPLPPLKTDQVEVRVPTDLRLIAQLIDRPVEELVQANPCLLRWTTPANDPHYMLNLPPGTKEVYEQTIVQIPPDRRIWWRVHKVTQGDTLGDVAKKYRVSKVALARANRLPGNTGLVEGVRLVLPMTPGTELSLARVRERGPRRIIHYRVRAGDTLDLIADRFDVTPYQIRRWNGMRSSGLVTGNTLRVYVGAAAESRHRTRRRPSRNGQTLRKAHSTPAGRSRTSP